MSISQVVSASSIKPIETLWKGYRFRSRLEARWAVFFEELGIRWEYEPQGFELSDGTRYLPDFYLPDQNLYVEIKPAINYKQQRVYMAGKIEHPANDWRLTIASSYPGVGSSLPGYHTYVGPYPLTDCGDHGGDGVPIPSTHGLGSYGFGFDTDLDEEGNVFKAHLNDVYESKANFNKNIVIRRCLDSIYRCDVLFAWISTLDCYGTLAEIGYAKALGKQIFIGISEDLSIPTSKFTDYNKPHNIEVSHDLWFVEGMANNVIRSRSPRHAFEHFMVKIPEPFNKIRQVDNGVLIAGNPYPDEYFVYRNWERGSIIFWDNNYFIIGHVGKELPVVKHALEKARAARFEHGERP